MTKRSCFAADSIGLPGVLTGGTVAALHALAELPYNPASSCPSCQGEYITLERGFAHRVGNLQADGSSPHDWALECETVITAEESPLDSGPSPTIVECYVRGNQGFVWTLNRCGFNFGRAGRRLVLLPEGLDLYLLELLVG